MPAHVVDSAFFADQFATPEMRRIFDDLTLLQRWLDAEAALACAEAEWGVIPTAAAAEIARHAHAEEMDLEEIKAGIDVTVHPLVPLIRVFAARCAGGAGEWIHWGATTQDIMDTAVALQLKEAYAVLDGHLAALEEAMAALAARHRDTVMAGRTHGQQALPITLGLKAAVWLDEVCRHRDRLRESRPRVLVGQLAGAAGTLASLGTVGLAVQRRMMEILDLGVPLVAWHTARDGFAEYTAILGMVTATAAKVAGEVIALQRTEIAEIEEPWTPGKVGSSTMPHKRNPMACETIAALGRLVRQDAALALDTMVGEHERDMGAWQAEWEFLPRASMLADAAVVQLTRVVAGVRVNPARMAANLRITRGLLLSEAVMLALGRQIGRQEAHDVVHAACMEAVARDEPLRAALLRSAAVTAHLSAAEIDRLLDPAGYVGLAPRFVDAVLAHHASRRAAGSGAAAGDEHGEGAPPTAPRGVRHTQP